jgi:hypothetical protein
MQMQIGDLPNVQRSRRIRRELQAGVRLMHESTVYGIGEAERYAFESDKIVDEVEKDIAELIKLLEWARDDIKKYRQQNIEGENNVTNV